jgi:Ca2+-transporting ATPase
VGALSGTSEVISAPTSDVTPQASLREAPMTVATQQPLTETAWHVQDASAVLASLGVEQARGLSSDAVTERQTAYGPNALAAGATESGLHAFLRQYADPMQIVLLVAGVISLYPIHEYETGIVLVGLTLFNAILGLHQEGKAAAAVAALQKMMIVQARATRDGKLVQIPAQQLVPGDIVSIEAGDLVPADGRLLQAATLEIAESALTGESLPVSKGVEAVPVVDTPLGDRTDMVFMNTNVTRGSGEFVVTSIGMATEVGHISGLLAAEQAAPTPLGRQLAVLTRQILWIAGAALLVSAIINLSRGDTFSEVFIAAIAFAVGALPENLPAVVTTILAFGTQELARAGAIMKRMQSTETLGSTSAINSDKTGTLTLNQMTAVQLAIAGRRYAVEGRGYSTVGQIKHVGGQPPVPLEQFLLPMVLASDAVIDEGELIGDPTEGALVALAAKGGVDAGLTRQMYPRIAELPFDAAYKLMATFHRMTDEDGRDVVRCYVKGAPDQLLARAGSIYDADRGRVPIDDSHRELYLAENTRLGEQGLRVMATASRDIDAASFDAVIADANADLLAHVEGLELLTLVGIVDPPRATARDSIATAKAAGIRVRMITGDHAVTAAAIAGQLGIEGRVLTGAEFEALSDDEAMRTVDEVGVIARVTPEDKVRLVKLLQRRGDIVAMTGDGVNDAPALKKADIGIAMGITGTEVTKEAAVMVITDDNFSTIVKAVELGRGLYDNLTKYIRFQMATLFGFVTTFLGSSIFNITGGVPFPPIQTLWINFTTALFQALGLGFGKPADDVMDRRPRPANERILPNPLLYWLIGVGVLIGGGTLATLAWAEHAHDAATAQTMGFTTLSIAVIAFSLATRHQLRSTFSLQTFADRTFCLFTLASVLTLLATTTLSPLERLLDTTELTAKQWGICTFTAIGVLIAAEIHKAVLRRTTTVTREEFARS